VNAIVADDELSESEMHYIQLNAELSELWPVINDKKDAPADADDWADKPNKLELLER
jgi:ferredoxin